MFVSKDENKIKELLVKSGIKDVVFIKDASTHTTHLNKRLTDEQIKRFRYYLNLEESKPKAKLSSVMPEIVRGYKGCIVSGNGLRFI